MTTDPKAPLPDEVAAALDFLHSYAQFNHRALIHRDNLRSHIAAQDEKIAELEAEKVRLLENYEAAFNRGLDAAHKMRHQQQQALLYEAIRNDKLEAENKRLLGLFKTLQTNSVLSEHQVLIVNEALAQTEQKS